jgi:hypothetical protein
MASVNGFDPGASGQQPVDSGGNPVPVGVWGDSTTGAGVFGTSGPQPPGSLDLEVMVAGIEGHGYALPGVIGQSETDVGAFGRSRQSHGLQGATISNDPLVAGVIGTATGGGTGVIGHVGGPATGVRGDAPDGIGVHGKSSGSQGVVGESTAGFGVLGSTLSASDLVAGVSGTATQGGTGVIGFGGAAGATGVRGDAQASMERVRRLSVCLGPASTRSE